MADGAADGELAVGALHRADPPVRLGLRVDRERPALADGREQRILGRVVVDGQPKALPLPDHDRIAHGADEVEEINGLHEELPGNSKQKVSEEEVKLAWNTEASNGLTVSQRKNIKVVKDDADKDDVIAWLASGSGELTVCLWRLRGTHTAGGALR